MSFAIGSRPLVSRPGVHTHALLPVLSWPYAVSLCLALIAAAGTGATLLIPDVLRGPAVMNGSARGTALVVLTVAVPVLLGSMYLVARGAVRPMVTWLGAATYTLYNSVLFLTATPFNSLFLLYVAMFALSVWTLALVLHSVDVHRFARRFESSLPARALGGFIGAVAVLNAMAWLAQAVPATLSSGSPSFLDGTGLITNPTFVQDLSFWLPLALVVAIWLWQRRAWGIVLAGALLVYGVIEGIGVATDQALGHIADPASSVVAVAAVPGFLALAAIELVAVYFYLRHLTGEPSPGQD